MRDCGSERRGVGFLWPLLLTAAAVAAAEPRMAVGPRIELYRNRRPVLLLDRDEIVNTEPHATDPEWLRVQRQGLDYTAPKAGLRTEWEVRGALRAEHSRQRYTIRRLTEQLDDNLQSRLDLMIAIAWAQYEGTLRYRIPVVAATPTPVPTYQLVRKLSPTRVRSLVRDWEQDLDGYAGDAQQDREQLVDLLARQARNAIAEWHVATLFNRFRRAPDRYRIEPAVVVAEPAELYQGQRPVAALQRGRLALAAPHPQEAGWLVVILGDRRFNSRAANFRTQSEVEGEAAGERAALDRELEDLGSDNAVLREHARFLQDLSRNLERGAALSPYRLRWARLPRRAWIRSTLATGLVAPEAGIEEIDPSAARRLLDDWEEQLDEISLCRHRNDERALQVQERLAKLEAFLLDLRSRFADLGYTQFPPGAGPPR